MASLQQGVKLGASKLNAVSNPAIASYPRGVEVLLVTATNIRINSGLIDHLASWQTLLVRFQASVHHSYNFHIR